MNQTKLMLVHMYKLNWDKTFKFYLYLEDLHSSWLHKSHTKHNHRYHSHTHAYAAKTQKETLPQRPTVLLYIVDIGTEMMVYGMPKPEYWSLRPISGIVKYVLLPRGIMWMPFFIQGNSDSWSSFTLTLAHN